MPAAQAFLDIAGAPEPKVRVKVLLPLPAGNGYDYAVPDGMIVGPGDFVVVPLGPRKVIGVAWGDEADGSVPDAKLKEVVGVLDAPPLSADVRDFVDWVAAYCVSPRGVVLRLVMRSGSALEKARGKSAFVPAESPPLELKLTEKRRAVLKAARPGRPMTAAQLAKRAGVTEAVVRGLAQAGALRVVELDPDPAFDPPDPDLPGRALSDDQAAAVRALSQKVRASGFSATLLDGVTGSGKTEVYLEAVAEALRADEGAQVLVLLPEIALTLPFLERIEARFGAPAAAWHSGMTSAARRRVWKRVADGGARLVVGARSALFLPYTNLKLIVVDEEHEAAYKQHDGVLYHARDMAVARGARQGFPVVLASATPSLETLANVEEGRYGRVELPSRFGPAELPDTQVVDMRASPPDKQRWLSPPIVERTTEVLRRGEQVMLYLNRRGYAPVVLCRKCGERMCAPDSDTWLVEHRYTNRLVCHHTGFSMPKPEACPHCGAHDSLSPCGPGVERVAEEAQERWPDARVEIFSSDTVQHAGAARSLLERMTAGEIDILVATQAAAKGHNFPGLTLVAAVDADLGLAGGDLRAAERTYQVLSQVSGRAGRAEKPGSVMLQSYQPEHPVIRALAGQDRDGFLAAELDGRRSLGFPPYGRLAALVLSGENEAKLMETAQTLVQAVPHADGVEVWGPAPAPLYRLRGTYRVRFLVKTARRVSVQNVLGAWLSRVKLPSSVRCTVDVDPYNFS
ncbi:primosomal protein N' [Parvularcula dongshanensis]|uniref:Replication restart protein PriA n=1 Tax=Parvularcula dongshanensis TaxID=1173995 RepID=A0A840I1W4_9PROT|nr:primosomal protein N' [Parvularcula dongshanensis]MBB4658335.1 primosomal protein N' (replication factor Y) [Parvularcula dongshanensis]